MNIKSVVLSTKPQRFQEGGRLHRNVRIYLHTSSKAELDTVKSVEYELHPTFKDRYRTSSNRAKDFEIRIWTWGYFDINTTIRLEDGTSKTERYYLRW